MSRPRHYWYGIVRQYVMRYYKLENYSNIFEHLYYCAINRALEKTKELPCAEQRLFAIEQILFKNQLTIVGVASRVHYSEYTVQRWITQFINLVGKEVGNT